jgi:hypothetical protein
MGAQAALYSGFYAVSRKIIPKALLSNWNLSEFN